MKVWNLIKINNRYYSTPITVIKQYLSLWFHFKKSPSYPQISIDPISYLLVSDGAFSSYRDACIPMSSCPPTYTSSSFSFHTSLSRAIWKSHWFFKNWSILGSQRWRLKVNICVEMIIKLSNKLLPCKIQIYTYWNLFLYPFPWAITK